MSDDVPMASTTRPSRMIVLPATGVRVAIMHKDAAERLREPAPCALYAPQDSSNQDAVETMQVVATSVEHAVLAFPSRDVILSRHQTTTFATSAAAGPMGLGDSQLLVQHVRQGNSAHQSSQLHAILALYALMDILSHRDVQPLRIDSAVHVNHAVLINTDQDARC